MLEQKLLKVQDQDFMIGKSGVFKLSLLVFIINLFEENLKASKPSDNININIDINFPILISILISKLISILISKLISMLMSILIISININININISISININIIEHPSSQGGKMSKCLVRWEHRL